VTRAARKTPNKQTHATCQPRRTVPPLVTDAL
jgi:hypothetical protein